MAERQRLKRRGLIAGAAALMAGIAAKQTSEPVRAVTDTNFNALGGGVAAFSCGNGYTKGVDVTANSDGVHSVSLSGDGVYGSSTGGYGVHGNSSSNGVYGSSTGDHAVYGNLLAPNTSAKAGVFGLGNGGNTFGVLGDGFGSGIGVQGQHGTIGVSGTVTAANAIGVQGSSTTGIGVYGTTSAAGQYGVLGQTLVNNSFGLTGIANGSGCAAFAGATTNPTSYAAYFQGHVQIEGAFDVIGAGNKHAVVPHPDGSHRTIYSIESPECWVEDFGTGTLVNGTATVKLDADFAMLVHTDTYHVFITEHDQHNDLHVTNRTAGSFVVQADEGTLKAKGKVAASVSGTFSWRVVAKPKTDAKVDRLAKATLAPKIDFTKLPKPPAPPSVAPTPPKKP